MSRHEGRLKGKGTLGKKSNMHIADNEIHKANFQYFACNVCCRIFRITILFEQCGQNVIYLHFLHLYSIYYTHKIFKTLTKGNLESICCIKCIELYVM
jgi:hypothetical protein